MATWRVTPKYKKSICEVMEFMKDGKTITHEITWRWGEFFVETEDDEPPVLEEGVDIFTVENFCDDWSTDDGVYEETNMDDLEDDEREQLEEFLEDNSIYDLEEQGWVQSDCYMYINCEMDIEKVDE